MRRSITANILVIALATALLYIPLYGQLFSAWSRSPDYSHGFFVLPIALFLVWLKRHRLAEATLKSSPLGLPLILMGLAIYVVGSYGRIASLQYLSFIIIVCGLILYLAGGEMLGELIFPVLFLMFMFPIPASLYVATTAPLQMWISKASVFAIDALGITVFREGNILHFANTSLEVTEACSGVRSILAFLMTGFLLAYFLKPFTLRTLLVLSIVPISFLMNFLRVTGTGILSHHFGAQAAQGFFHEFAGAGVFLVGAIFLLAEFHVLSRVRRDAQ
jgi:exosortase